LPITYTSSVNDVDIIPILPLIIYGTGRIRHDSHTQRIVLLSHYR